jgi:hypothetical protein
VAEPWDGTESPPAGVALDPAGDAAVYPPEVNDVVPPDRPVSGPVSPPPQEGHEPVLPPLGPSRAIRPSDPSPLGPGVAVGASEDPPGAAVAGRPWSGLGPIT